MLHRCERILRTLVVVTLLILATPAMARASDGPFLQRGDRSAQVATMQRLLIFSGVPVAGGADGIYGNATTTAVRDYQRRRGLPVNGTVDVATATALGMLPGTPLLAKGSSGKAVRRVQQQLLAVGLHVPGGVDGVYGTATAKAVRAFQVSRYLPATGSLDAATAAILAKAAGATPAPAPAAVVAVSLAAFPVPRTCAFWNTWGAPRSGGRVHQGVDILASKGTPVRAVVTGRITRQHKDFPGSLGGNQMWLTGADGTSFFYAHLSAFAKGVGAGSPVHAGDVIGYVGSTGSASIAHLHFEVHPHGGAPVNPYPILTSAANC